MNNHTGPNSKLLSPWRWMFVVSAVKISFLIMIYHGAGTVVHLLLRKFSLATANIVLQQRSRVSFPKRGLCSSLVTNMVHRCLLLPACPPKTFLHFCFFCKHKKNFFFSLSLSDVKLLPRKIKERKMKWNGGREDLCVHWRWVLRKWF